ncbi:unnamed protein product [Staurois parvus]|uniref:Uncharacterized protein n=1 Tax=Staurois parvus TaxID=386267 RepID=A0ABN9FCP2_9NEOB|nr:unnamed protein product [Staurois parvus]
MSPLYTGIDRDLKEALSFLYPYR